MGGDQLIGRVQPAWSRPHPQTTYNETTIDPSSFYGKLRSLYAKTVLKTQLEQMKKQGSYDAFKLEWHDVYDLDGLPPSLFWDSDVGKWIEAACYFLSSPCSDADARGHNSEFARSVQYLVDLIEKAQHPDGYLNIYFTVVDPEGRLKNLRDMHQMYNAGHLLEGALAHYHYTGSRQFLNVMIRNVDCFMKHLGPNKGQLHGYPGHPEFELAVLRLYAVTMDERHLEFGRYLLSARGVERDDQDGKTYFVYEAGVREDPVHPITMNTLVEQSYNLSHLPLHEQNDILGHSVRAFYLTTAAADCGGAFVDDARRLFENAVNKKMYVTGGFGSDPRIEGFSDIPHFLPQSSGEGGCYAETCASIAAIMTGERLLSHGLDGSLDGTAFSYENKLATYADEVATREGWFEVACCPPNLARTLGMLGGYVWTIKVDAKRKRIRLDVYLFVSAKRTVELPDGSRAVVTMKSEMPWSGETMWSVKAPEGWSWDVQLPKPRYAENLKVSRATVDAAPGFVTVRTPATDSFEMTFDMPVQLLVPHPDTHQDTLTISRGPIVYVAESFDNAALEVKHTHFEGVGICEDAKLEQVRMEISDVSIVGLKASPGSVFTLREESQEAYRPVTTNEPARRWIKSPHSLTLVPWFARANRGGAGHVRTAFLRADKSLLCTDTSN